MQPLSDRVFFWFVIRLNRLVHWWLGDRWDPVKGTWIEPGEG
jgi:hypothetical protein